MSRSIALPLSETIAQCPSTRFDAMHAREIVEWAASEFAEGLVMSSSFGAESAALLHMATCVLPRIPVIVVDTGFLFEQTRAFMDQLDEALNLNLQIYRPMISSERYLQDAGETDPTWRQDVERCCRVNKNEPFARAMRELGPAAWLRGIRADQTPARHGARTVEWSRRFECWAISPLIHWDSDDVHDYLRKHDLPVHPLWSQGYRSIGCNPLSCTRAVAEDEDDRAGRWSGRERTECGLHMS